MERLGTTFIPSEKQGPHRENPSGPSHLAAGGTEGLGEARWWVREALTVARKELGSGWQLLSIHTHAQMQDRGVQALWACTPPQGPAAPLDPRWLSPDSPAPGPQAWAFAPH